MGSGGIAPRIRKPRHYMEANGQLHAPAALPSEKELWYPSDMCVDGPQSRSESGV
jgi:hypothetical protein